MAKTYIVVKNGQELEKFKSLSAAKKHADEAGAEVYSDGKCVYQGAIKAAGTAEAVEETEAVNVTEAVESAADNTATVDATENTTGDKTENTAGDTTATVTTRVEITRPNKTEPETTRYRLKGFMNVRKKPSLHAPIVGTRPADSVVRVLEIVDDWLHLANDTYILYENGKWAEKV